MNKLKDQLFGTNVHNFYLPVRLEPQTHVGRIWTTINNMLNRNWLA